jgi:D-alanyl-lipoteichoic acid acyltransferase DltB (MBOAT superfamily)
MLADWAGLLDFVQGPFLSKDGLPWQDAWLTNWRDFWLSRVLDERFVVVWFLPLLPILALLRRDRLRLGVVLTGLVFLGYLCGVAWAVAWLITGLLFFRLSESFARESKRTDVLPIGPPLAAIAIVGGWYFAVMLLDKAALPPDVNAWLFAHARWLYPLGARQLAWEPTFYAVAADPGPPALLHALFYNPHYVGTAYLAVRMLHYFSELRRDTIPPARRTPLNFLAYVCYAPALLQGPVERYDRFQEEMDTCHERRRWANLVPAGGRIGMGLAKAVGAHLWLHPFLVTVYGEGGTRLWAHPEQIASFWLVYTGVFFVIFTLYLEFSGYCDIVVGIGWLLGYRQAENFAMPWRATSLRDFWRRWHITLSAILRDYIYIPLGGNRKRQLLNMCLTFGLCGLWHRLMFQVFLWGVLMGVMVSINGWWVRWMERLDRRPAGLLPAVRRNWLRMRPLPQITAWFVTQNAFLFSLLLFFGGNAIYVVTYDLIRRVFGLPSVDFGPR